jgi:hypothetical protein
MAEELTAEQKAERRKELAEAFKDGLFMYEAEVAAKKKAEEEAEKEKNGGTNDNDGSKRTTVADWLARF